MEDYATSALGSMSILADDGRDATTIVVNYEGQLTQWHDQLQLLDTASDEMELGDLLAGQSFELQDAMSALEMMDPQMDTGMAVAAAQSAEDDEPLPTLPDEVPDALVIGLLDDILCAEHGWYRGLSLTQTVYKLEWMQSAPDVVDVRLRSTLCATARAVAAARSIVLRGDVHEEEDFNGTLSGLILHDQVTDADLAAMLQQAEEQCAKAVLAAKAEAGVKASAAEGEQAATEPPPSSASSSAGGSGEAAGGSALDLAQAVLCRVRFRQTFCSAMLHLARPSARALEAAKRMLAQAEQQLDQMAGSVALGTPREQLAYCLGGRAVRKRLGSAPTKRPEWLGRGEGVTASRELLAQLRQLCGVAEASEDYDSFLRWVEDLTTGTKPAPSILVRSAVQLYAVSEDPRGPAPLRAPITELLAGIISAYSGLDGAQTRELLSLAPVTELMQQIGQGELSRLRLRNMNPARSRRRLRHYLRDWAPLQDLAEALDTQLERAGYVEPGLGPYGPWCLHRTLKDMLWFITMGFELELYAPCEFGFVYWYKDLLCGMALRLHQEVNQKAMAAAKAVADFQNQEAEAAYAAALQQGGSGKKKKLKPPKPVPPRQVVTGSLGIHTELRLIHVMLDLSRGCYMLLAALSQLGLMPPYESEFMPLQRRFDMRFAPFRVLARPPPFGYEFFAKESIRLSEIASADLLRGAASHFKAARAKLDGPLKADPKSEGALSPALRAEATRLVKVAVANSVVILSLERSPPPELSVAKFSFAAHPSFVTVSIGPKSARC
jgi:hypothetical protein